MKLSKLMWGFMAAAAFSACSNDDIVPDGDNNQIIDGESRFLAVQIANPAAARTRAGGDQTEEDDYLFEEGYTNENEVKSLRFYFFDKNGDPCNVRHEGTANYYDVTSLGGNAVEMPNVEKKMNVVLVISTKAGDEVGQLKSMVAVLNHEKLNLGTNELTLSQLRAKIGDYSSTDKGFVMTSSTFGSQRESANDPFCCEVEVSSKYLKETETLAMGDPVQVYVERVLAKVRLYVGGDLANGVQKVTYNDKEYNAVLLKKKVGEDYETLTYKDKDVYLILKGWDVTSTAPESYLFKKAETSWNLGWTWRVSDLHRSYWAQNPEKLVDGTKWSAAVLKHLSYNEIEKVVGTVGVVDGSSKSYNGDVAYCLENAAEDNDGTKTTYDADEALSNRTQAIIAGILVTVDESNNATPLKLAQWGGKTYTKEDALKDMLNVVQTRLFTKRTEGEGTEAKEIYESITTDMVELVSAEDAGFNDDLTDAENDKRYLSYLQLSDNGEKVTFYNENKETLSEENVNNILREMIGAKVWETGMTYYYTDIEHEKDADAQKGKYGVVRNHIYDIRINTIAGFGTPVLNPDNDIIPQKPKDDETYMAAQINILSWRVVQQDVDLNW